MNAPNLLKFKDALKLVTTNLESLLGIDTVNSDIVATSGGHILDSQAKVIAVINQVDGLVEIFD